MDTNATSLTIPKIDQEAPTTIAQLLLEVNEKQATLKKQLCESCSANPSKYSCPSCRYKSCCLECINIHKSKYGCSGKRDPTAYTPISKFTDDIYTNDALFLENMSRVADNISRNGIEVINVNGKRNMNLVKACNALNINLCLMPKGMKRQKCNRTVLNRQLIKWTIEFEFVVDGIIAKKVSNYCEQESELQSFIDTHLSCEQLERFKVKSFVWMKMEGGMARFPQYYRVDSSMSVMAILGGKSVIEFPTFIVTVDDFEKQEFTGF